MKYCPNCGKELKEGASFCANCGTKVKTTGDKINEEAKKIEDKAKEIYNDVKDSSKNFTKKEKEDGKVMAILAYIGILCLIPYFAEKNNKYVHYHAVQGINLFILEIIAYAATGILFFGFLAYIVSVISFILSIIGIVNVCNGEAKELPLIKGIKLIKD